MCYDVHTHRRRDFSLIWSRSAHVVSSTAASVCWCPGSCQGSAECPSFSPCRHTARRRLVLNLDLDPFFSLSILFLLRKKTKERSQTKKKKKKKKERRNKRMLWLWIVFHVNHHHKWNRQKQTTVYRPYKENWLKSEGWIYLAKVLWAVSHRE